MAKKSFQIRGNLAQALDDTVASANNHAGELRIEAIPLRKIQLDPDNPRDLLLTFTDLYNTITGTEAEQTRKHSDFKSLESIAKSIIEQGIINPIVVYKQGDYYILVAGERRTLASIIAKKQDIPAKILAAKPEPLKLSLLQWAENIEREDLSLWERLRNLEQIITALANKRAKKIDAITGAELGSILGCSIQQAIHYRTLLQASDNLKHRIKQGEIANIEKAAFIARSPQPLEGTLINACIDGNTLAEMKKMVKHNSTAEPISITNRAVTKINFGHTKHPEVAKTILQSVLNNRDLQSYTSQLSDVDWQDPKSIALSFRKLIKLLEAISTRES